MLNDKVPGEGRWSRRAILRNAAVAGLAIPAGSLFAACGTSDTGRDQGGAKGQVSADNPLGVDPKAPLEVVIFKGGYGDEYAKFDEQLYSARFPDAKISHSAIQEIQQELQPKFVAGNPPDVVDNTGAKEMNLGALVADDQLADLAPLLDAASLDDKNVKVAETLLPGALDSGTYDGKVRALNYVFTVFGIWYSKSLFESKGWTYPKTWDEMFALCSEIKKSGMAPWVYGGQNAVSYVANMIMSVTAKQHGVDALKNIDNLEPGAWSATKDAAEVVYRLAKDGYILDGSAGLIHTQAQTEWVKGKAAFYASGSWIENEMKGITPNGFAMVCSPTPSLSASDSLPHTAIHASASESFIVPSAAHNARGGMEFLRIMLSKAAAAKFSELTHSPTVVKGATGGQDFGSTALASINKMIDNAGENIFNFVVERWYLKLYNEVGTQMGNLLAARIDPPTFVKRCQAAADATAKDASIKKFRR